MGFSVLVYQAITALVVVFIFFITGRPYFDPKLRVFISAICAGVLNAFAGGAARGTELSGLPLRFLVAFLLVGAGVAVLEYLFPQGSNRFFRNTRD
jgi:NAD/NADP transhydrogenase beta subunit